MALPSSLTPTQNSISGTPAGCGTSSRELLLSSWALDPLPATCHGTLGGVSLRRQLGSWGIAACG